MAGTSYVENYAKIVFPREKNGIGITNTERMKKQIACASRRDSLPPKHYENVLMLGRCLVSSTYW
jgi:hypothetical protein